MTNQYYGYEDEGAVSETRLAELESTTTTLAASNQAARETLQAISAVGGELWQKAVADNDTVTQERLTRLGQFTTQINENRELTAAALAGTLEAAKQFIAELDHSTSQLEELQEAIYDDDRSNLFVNQLALSIEADIKEIAMDEAYSTAIVNARSEVWQEVAIALKSACPRATWHAIHRLIAALEEQNSNEQHVRLSKQQLGLLSALVNSFEEQAAAS